MPVKDLLEIWLNYHYRYCEWHGSLGMLLTIFEKLISLLWEERQLSILNECRISPLPITYSSPKSTLTTSGSSLEVSFRIYCRSWTKVQGAGFRMLNTRGIHKTWRTASLKSCPSSIMPYSSSLKNLKNNAHKKRGQVVDL